MPIQIGRLSKDVLNAALAGLEAQSRKIDEHIQQVKSMLGLGGKRRGRPPKSESATAAPAAAAPKKRRFSAATRAKMRAAQQKRWAALKGTTAAPAKAAPAKAARPAKAAPAKATRKKRKLSAAGRKRIIEATKKRWAEYKAKKAATQKGS